MVKLVFLQLNEVNFKFIDKYIEQGKLPNFAALFRDSPYVVTQSESEHHLANPWIQWPTVHTGKTYAEHGVFRLGDIAYTDHPHIYEVLEDHGVRVGAMSPFNAKNNTKHAAFFVPDPWTDTRFDGPPSLRWIYDAVKQVTDDYANKKIAPASIARLVSALAVNGRLTSLPSYMKEAMDYFLKGAVWARATICDRLLADAFITQCKRTQPDFATLFMNGGAHLQHHYLFSSKAYDGERENPDWQCPKGTDPLGTILQMYDDVLGEIKREMPEARLMIATALHQDAHERETFYFRLDDHEAFLNDIGLQFKSTYRLMTEDFVVMFESEEEAAKGEQLLENVKLHNTDPIFYVETGDSAVRTHATYDRIFHIENRGDSLYIQLRPSSKAIPESAQVMSGNKVIEDFGKRVSFAQYKNTHHHGDGYFLDTGLTERTDQPIPLTSLFDRVLQAFNINDTRKQTVSHVAAE